MPGVPDYQCISLSLNYRSALKFAKVTKDALNAYDSTRSMGLQPLESCAKFSATYYTKHVQMCCFNCFITNFLTSQCISLNPFTNTSYYPRWPIFNAKMLRIRIVSAQTVKFVEVSKHSSRIDSS